ncbi:MAG: DUF4920 domain-containing protein [Kofleriaceae bacterium]
MRPRVTRPRSSALVSSRRWLAAALLAPGTMLAVGCDRGPVGTGEARAAAVAADPTATATPTPTTATPTTPTAAPAGTIYGAGVKLPTTVAIDDILADPKAYAGKPLRVEGMVTDVCPKRGCWFEMAGAKAGQKLMFKVQDGDMVFPLEAKGSYAVAEGVLAVRELTLEETRAQAEYRAKEYGIPYDPATLTEPGVSIRLDGTGAVLRDQK